MINKVLFLTRKLSLPVVIIQSSQIFLTLVITAFPLFHHAGSKWPLAGGVNCKQKPSSITVKLILSDEVSKIDRCGNRCGGFFVCVSLSKQPAQQFLRQLKKLELSLTRESIVLDLPVKSLNSFVLYGFFSNA